MSYTVDDFIKKANEVHGGKYDYSRVSYVNTSTPVEIVCPTHGSFKQRPLNHLQGNGCKKCQYERLSSGLRISNDDFIRRAIEVHKGKYDYSNVIYKGTHSKILIVCKDHGIFSQKPSDHLNGQGCPACARLSSNNFFRKRQLSAIEFIERARKIHGNKYDYSEVNYKDTHTKVRIRCLEKYKDGSEHGWFEQKPNHHLSSAMGCPKCGRVLSKAENHIARWLEEHGVGYVRQFRIREFNVYKAVDFYLPELDVYIEYDGRQHFEPRFGKAALAKQQQLDEEFNTFCRSKNLKLLRLNYKRDYLKILEEYINELI